jgi:tetratricopeptide (TPR) repeat protein
LKVEPKTEASITEAEKFTERAVSFRKEIIDCWQKRPPSEWVARQTLDARNDLATTYRDLGRKEEARKIREQVLSEQRQKFPGYHKSIIMTLCQYAIDRRKTPGSDEATQEYLKECRQYCQDLGDVSLLWKAMEERYRYYRHQYMQKNLGDLSKGIEIMRELFELKKEASEPQEELRSTAKKLREAYEMDLNGPDDKKHDDLLKGLEEYLKGSA